MKRLIISLGLAWALIYTANHTVFVRAASDTDAKVATSIEQVSTDRRIDSWGPYLPNVRPPLPDENPQSHHLKLANLARLLHAKSKPTQHLMLILLPRQKRRVQTLAPKRVGS
jgi:hypothetical protein